jgi:hypothetical protein
MQQMIFGILLKEDNMRSVIDIICRIFRFRCRIAIIGGIVAIIFLLIFWSLVFVTKNMQ